MRRIESFPTEIPRSFEQTLTEGRVIIPSSSPRKLRRTLYRYRDALVAADSPLALRYANISMLVEDDKLILENRK